MTVGSAPRRVGISKKCSILMVTGIYAPDLGGPATYVPKVANELTRRGHEIVVLTLGEVSSKQVSRGSFEVVTFPRQQLPLLRTLRSTWAIFVLSKKVDGIFVNGLAFQARLANLVRRKPVAQKIVSDFAWDRAHLWGWFDSDPLSFQETRGSLKIGLLKVLRAWWAKGADSIIVPSKHVARLVAGWGIQASRIHVIPNGVEIPVGTRPAEISLHTKTTFVTTGRLIPLKRVAGIIQALVDLPDVGLLIIGEGPERNQLEELVRKLKLQERVTFCGAVRHEDALSLMAGCDALVLNSVTEGLSHVALEALALGLPVVATNVGGNPEVVVDGLSGLLFDSTSPLALKDAMQRLAADPQQRERMSQEAKLRAAQFKLSATLSKAADHLETTFRCQISADEFEARDS